MGTKTIQKNDGQETKMSSTEKNTIKNLLKKPLALFKKKEDNIKKETKETCKNELSITREMSTARLRRPHTNAIAADELKREINKPVKVITEVDRLKANLQQLQINKKLKDLQNAENAEDLNEDSDDEFKQFTVKIVSDFENRKDSNQSEDSGFSDRESFTKTLHNNTENETEELNECFKKLNVGEHLNKIEVFNENVKKLNLGEKSESEDLNECFEKLNLDGGNNKGRLKTVYLARGPIRSRDKSGVSNPYQQIHQINHQTFTGSQVYVNPKSAKVTQHQHLRLAQSNSDFQNQTISRQNQHYGDFEMDLALTQLQNNINNFPENPLEGQIYWQSAQEFLRETFDQNNEETINILSDFKELDSEVFPVMSEANYTKQAEELNPIEEFANADNLLAYNSIELNIDQLNDLVLTPPRSEMSPISINALSPYPYTSNNLTHSGSDSMLSPALSTSPNLSKNDDYEKYQDLAGFEESIPTSVIANSEKFASKNERNKVKNTFSMKQFKDVQNDLMGVFSKKDCCNRKSGQVKDVFRGFFNDLCKEERGQLCLRVAALDLKTCYGVLHHIIENLSTSSDKVNRQMALFGMLCERILAEKPLYYIEHYGLSLLKSASLRCPHRPLLTRYLVACVRAVLRTEQAKLVSSSEPIFNEVDINGDTLVSALASRGDECSDVLAELFANTHEHNKEPSLFDVHHCNIEGYTALHTACMAHGNTRQCLHTVHVLIAHASSDLWKGDMKGGDSALHHAVRSSTCDLALVMCLFKHVPRSEWKRLAHHTNRSSTTPLDLARIAAKCSGTKHDYPTEVLNFLKKCR